MQGKLIEYFGKYENNTKINVKSLSSPYYVNLPTLRKSSTEVTVKGPINANINK